ncbi:hypothetical protein BEL04_14580 [Mucilaginibacter sp. PPCGB 2223]|uniref:hypothetical protein n=1 Tax=Mucilaginibacter sp. PPCGB 2223 TaxID=1886027 RepID=UPI000825475B|nr:hypothetical protein [Mucilaginibacter sp. PPCGB 2223]OCX52669.1 hypothetical protein BEL04_14580 [Mucilaginibacter sp. PPCGB 2223]
MDDTKKALLSIDIDTTALTQNVNNAKAAVADLKSQLDNLKAAGKDSGDAFDKLSEQLKKAGEDAKKSNDALKEHTKGLSDSTAAANNLKGGLIDLSKQHNSLQGDTAKSTKSVSDYTNSFLKAVESVTPFGKSIAETAEKFKTLQEGAGKVGSALGLLKKDGDDAATNAQTLSTNAGKATKGFEALTTGTEAASGGVSTFTKALAGTGIGLIIIAVAALIDYLKQVTPVVDAVERVTAGLTGGFNALGRIVMDLLSPLKKLFTDPKQAMKDLVDFLEQNVINRFKAFGVIVDGLVHGNLKQFADGVIQLGTGVTNATDKIVTATTKIGEYSKAIWDAGKATANLKGEQQELARSVEGEALKAKQTAAEIAEQQVKAQTGTVAQRKAALAEIARLEAAQAKLHKDNIDKGVDLAVQDVGIKRGLTQQEINLLKTRGAAELEDLEKKGRIYADDVKALSDALGKKLELRKADAEKRKQLRSATAAYKKKPAAPPPPKAEDDTLKNQELRDQKELFDLKQEAAIKAVEKDHDAIFMLRQQQIEKDRQFELQQTKLTQTQIDIINERYDQQQNQVAKTHAEAQRQQEKDDQNKRFDAQLKQDQLDIAKTNNNYKLKLQAQAKYLDDKHKADLFNAQGDAKEIAKIDAQYLKDKQQLASEEQKLLLRKAQNYAGYFSTLTGLFGKNTQASKAAFAAQKAIAAAEIAINTEKQVSSIFTATRSQVAGDIANFGPIVGPVKAAIDIAIGAAEIVGTIANGIKQATTINSTNPKGFARGGVYISDGYGAYLMGPGTGTSDSINARLSHGESVINARSTEMFAPILSAINIAGGGRSFNSSANGHAYALGGLFNGSNTLNDGSNDLATTRATNDMVRTIAANMPRQILVVEDVQASLNNKVMLQNMSNF